jgi:hypothetical protein
MELRARGVVAVALTAALCNSGCAQSHDGERAPLAQDPSVLSESSPADATARAGCGGPEPQLPVLFGSDGTDVWLRWNDGRQERVHSFDLADPAVSPGMEPPRLRVTDSHLLVSIGGEQTEHGVRPQSHVLLTRRGEPLWVRDATADQGEVWAFGADGSLLLRNRGLHTLVRTDGSQRRLAAGFVPSDAADAAGWLPGSFSEHDVATGHGFQHVETDEQRVLVGETRSDLRALGSQDVVDGRFYYTLIDSAGVPSLVVEGPDLERTFVLDGETELPSLTRGSTHTLIHVGTRPVALLERASLELTPLAGQPAPSVEDGQSLYLRADGDWFVVTVENPRAVFDAAHPGYAPPVQRVYRIHAPTGWLDAEPALPVPEGLARFDYSPCIAGLSGQSVDGQLVQGLAPLADATPLVQLYIEGLQDEGWTAIGQPIAFGIGLSAQRVGESWLLRSGDVRNTYCNFSGPADPSALGPDVLVGYSVQVVAPDGEVIAFEANESTRRLEHEIALDVDGRCALISREGETWIHDLTSHEEQVIDLPNARWLPMPPTGR